MPKFISLTAKDGHKLNAYHAEANEAIGGLVIIQEIFGVNKHIREVVEQYAENGFEVIAPALFDRVALNAEFDYSKETMAKGREYVAKIGGWDKSLLDIDACLQKLKEKYGKNIATLGFCWGGSLSWLSATRLAVACAVTYYGGQIISFKDEKPKCPVMMHFGDKDVLIDNEDVEKIKLAQPEVELYTYPAGHGFNCDGRGDYNVVQANIARERTLNFLKKHFVL
jgi:carboxymethylenebutenolidase